MKLAKPRIDIGFATNNAPAALAFWQNEIGLPFDHTQPIRRGYKQHRHDLCGSILKINQVYEPLPDNFKLLQKNLVPLNGRVALNNHAVGNPAHTLLYLGRNNCGEASFFNIGEQQSEGLHRRSSHTA